MKVDYPRVTHPFATQTSLLLLIKKFAFDLHVLSTPPAFVLSQNQTLRKKTAIPPRRDQSFELSNLTTVLLFATSTPFARDAVAIGSFLTPKHQENSNSLTYRTIQSLRLFRPPTLSRAGLQISISENNFPAIFSVKIGLRTQKNDADNGGPSN